MVVAGGEELVSQLKQMQMIFEPEEDRLLLKVNTQSNDEFRFWLTRRFVRMIWPALMKALASSPQIVVQRDQTAKEAVLAFQQEKVLSQADFQTPYREDATNHPLGEEPLLVARAQFKPGPDKQRMLGLHPAEGPGIEIALNDAMLHSLCALITKTVAKTDWQLDLTMARSASSSGPDPERLN